MEMTAKISFTIAIPDELMEALGITDETPFETFMEDGVLHISPIPEDDFAGLVCDGDCEDCPANRIDCEGNCRKCPCYTQCEDAEVGR